MERDIIFEKLDWDSAFFGINVCRIRSDISGEGVLGQVLQALHAAGIDLAYYSAERPLQPGTTGTSLFDIVPVDRKLTYFKPVNPLVQPVPSVASYSGSEPDAALVRLAILSGTYSRFQVDHRIGRAAFEKLYTQWIINSVHRSIAQEVLIHREDGAIRGFVTLGGKAPVADIGLIATDPAYQGKGIGRQLMVAAENWFAVRQYTRIQVITQFDNIPARRLYERCGYGAAAPEYFYHFWNKTGHRLVLQEH